ALYGDNPVTDEGVVFVFFGRRSWPMFVTAADVTLDNPDGEASGLFGIAVTAGGDVTGDGVSDLIVSAHYQDHPESNEGIATIYLGGGGWASSVASPDVVIDNPADQANGHFGRSVAQGCDVNGDGRADVLIGAPNQDNPEVDEGVVYVVF